MLVDAHNQPHVLDFGLAKITRADDSDHPTLTNLGNVYLETDRLDEAIANYDAAVSIYRALLPDAAGDLKAALQSLALAYMRRDALNDAEQVLGEALGLPDGDSELDRLHLAHTLASLQMKVGKLAEAEATLRGALESRRDDSNDDTELIIAIKSNLAVLLRRQKRPGRCASILAAGRRGH